MNIVKLETKEQFESLKKDDCILVKWSDYYTEHTPGAKKINLYNIYENKTNDRDSEIICQKRHNHYFNWKMHLEGRSVAEEVYLVEVAA